jgi:hypothetical protein
MPSRRVHLVGTCPAQNTAAAMALMQDRVGAYLHSIPSGEVEDPDWVVSTVKRREQHPNLRVLKHFNYDKPALAPYDGAILVPRRGGDLTQALALDYADKAAAALRIWRTLDTEAALQVGIPGPFDLAAFTFGPGALHFYDYEVTAALTEIWAINRDNDQLTYQLEIPLETYLVAKAPCRLQPKIAARLTQRVGAFIDATPTGSRWIVHLCVGDPHGKPLIELSDASPLVILANAISTVWPHQTHTLDAIHFPFASGTMPAQTNSPFYEPLAGLALPELTHCSAGLVTLSVSEAYQRQALNMIEDISNRSWGISTPCGMGRIPDLVIPTLERLAALAAN